MYESMRESMCKRARDRAKENEFRIQNEEQIGFPTVDVFLNAQVRRTRLYFKVDNATSSLTDRNYFSATKILAKHDENYMPPEVKEAIGDK
jgi:hypothetical protein